MPNWCDNELTIRGPIEKLKEFDAQFKKDHVVYNGGTAYTQDLDTFLKNHKNVIDYKLVEKVVDKSKPISMESIGAQIHYLTGEELRKDEYSFSNFIPNSRETFLNDWYNWNIVNWGTKWDLTMYSHPEENDWGKMNSTPSIFYSYATAWGPAQPVVEAMASQFPELTFEYKYREDGMQFAGSMEFSEGDIIWEESSQDEDYKEFILRHFDEEMFRCQKCQNLMEIYELDDNEDKCTKCDSTDIVEAVRN